MTRRPSHRRTQEQPAATTAPEPHSDEHEPGPDEAPPDPLTLIRSRGYAVMLVGAAALGVPIAVVSYWFLQLSTHLQGWLFTDLPGAFGFDEQPTWWPIPVLVVGGLVVALTIRYLPGQGGESPADGFHAGGAPTPAELPGIALAALATIGFGAVLGPEHH